MCEIQVRGCQFEAVVVVNAHRRLAPSSPCWTFRFSVTYLSSS